jgi:crotonyl-CoA carboxylase/reductase
VEDAVTCTLAPVRTSLDFADVPQSMPAWVHRRGRSGSPREVFERAELPVPEPGRGEVLVQVMAAGVNYNAVWAAKGHPRPVHDLHGEALHVPGSDASGVVWRVGPGVTRWKPGDEVIVHCNVHCGVCAACTGFGAAACEDQRLWGYETPHGSYAQFARVQAQQLLRKPKAFTWEAAASYGLVCFTAYRMLVDRARVRPNDAVLVWGAGGGLGVFAVQITKLLGATAIGVVASDARAALARSMGCDHIVDRRAFPELPYEPGESAERQRLRHDATRAFAEAVRAGCGGKKGPDVVFEHVGRETFPASVYVGNRFSRIVLCGATTGYDLHFDARHLWSRQKSIVGSHFANAEQCQRANDLVHQGRIKAVLSETFPFDGMPDAHERMRENLHRGTMACLVASPQPGLCSLDDVRRAVGSTPGAQ